MRPATLLLAGLSLWTAGCATRSVPPRSGTATPTAKPGMPATTAKSEPVTVSPQPAASGPAPADEPPPADAPPPVIVALLDESEASRSAGDLESAVSTTERALRIQPRNPRLWQALAKVRLQQGEAALAEDLARRSSVLAAGNESLLAENQGLIAAARQRQGLAPSDPGTGEE
jgi:Flp pilus assembly protein TadD